MGLITTTVNLDISHADNAQSDDINDNMPSIYTG